MVRNDSEIIQLNGIGLFTKEDGDSSEEGEAPEDTIGKGINTNALKHTKVTNSLCTNDCIGSGTRSLNEHTAPCHFRYCLEMKVV